eukprot:m.323535 g.323535  ORF g.323535 m.323535 type:complete len:93 (-) comp29581_c0_seq1:30-308(-)
MLLPLSLLLVLLSSRTQAQSLPPDCPAELAQVPAAANVIHLTQPFTSLPNGCFTGFPAVVLLNISGVGLTDIAPAAFSGLASLELLSVGKPL